MNNTIYWHKEGEFLKETPRMVKIKNIKIDYRYEEYIASLRSIPILPGSVWKKDKELVEGVDFETQTKFISKGSVLVALPLPSGESQEDIWRDMIRVYALTPGGIQEEIEALSKHFTIARNTKQ